MVYKVTIIIPVFNAEKYINQCLNSVLNQTLNFNDIQIIIINDASTDNTGKIIENYTHFKNIEYISLKSNTGSPSYPRNIGIEKAKGEYIVFLDADDILEKHYLEVLINQIDKEKSNIVISSVFTIYSTSDDIPNFPDNLEVLKLNPLDKPYNPIPLTVWGKIFRKGFLEKNNIYFNNETNWEDVYFMVLSFSHEEDKISYLSNYYGYIYSKRQWGSSLSSSNRAESLMGGGISKLNSLKDIFHATEKKKLYNFYRFSFNYFISSIAFSDDDKKTKKEFSKKLKETLEELNMDWKFPHNIFYYLFLKEKFQLIFLFCKLYKIITKIRGWYHQ